MPKKPLRPTYDFLADRIDQLKQIVPEAFVDGNINWETLQEALGEYLEDETTEHFGLSWPGKRNSRRLAAQPSRGTLVPAEGNGIDENTTQNLFIEGDNLEVLKLLQKSYASRVKMIYIDPPYNTGNDFIYEDDFTEPLESYLRKTGQVDEAGVLLVSNTLSDGRFHSNWLNMMYPRLLLARQLLQDDGLIFISIDDNEFHNLHHLMDEIFGSERLLGVFVWKSRQMVDNRTKTGVSTDHEYILCYGKTADAQLRGAEKDLSKFSNPDNDARGPWRSADLTGLATKDRRPNLHYDLTDPETGSVYPCPPKGWRFDRNTMKQKIDEGRILFPNDPSGRPRHKLFLNEMDSIYTGFSTISTDIHTTHGTKDMLDLFGEEVIQFPKPVNLIRRLIEQAVSDREIVLDFFAGSATTAQAVIEQNIADQEARHFIMIQIPELSSHKTYSTIAEIGKERIRRVVARIQNERDGQLDIFSDQDLGFKVFKLKRSHFKKWTAFEGDNVSDLQTQMDMFESPLVDNWQEYDLLIEVVLQEGFPLDSAIIHQEDFLNNNVYMVESDFHEQRLFICLDATVGDNTIARLQLGDSDVFICLDSALTDQSKMRLSDRANLHVI